MLDLGETAAFPADLPQGSGIAVAAPTGLGLASLQPLGGQFDVVAGRLEAELGLRLTDDAVRVTRGGLAAMGVGPGRWLLSADGAGNHFAKRLSDIVGDAAAVNDQSDGYAVLHLSGPGCYPVLARGVNIDLDPRVFAVGSVAVTAIAHIGVVLWRAEDDATGPAFGVAVFRSMAGSLLHWLETSIAGAGLALR